MNNYVIPQSTRKQYTQTSLQENANKAYAHQRAYTDFVDSVTPSLVAEAMNYILQNCLENKSEEDKKFGRVLCEQYVQENNANAMLRQFKTKSVLLAETALCVEAASKKIINHTDRNTLNFTIKASDKKDFYRTLDDLSVDEVCKKINERVCAATEEFIQNNVNDKLDMEELAQKTKENIDAVKASSKETEEAIKQEHANLYHEAVNNIATGYNRSKNIYEQMINVATKSVVKDMKSYPMFVNESGKLDMAKITDKVDVMYTFLEMLNTTKMRKVDTAYIQECINSIK